MELCSIVNAKPSYTEVVKWAKVNWKDLNPKITQLKPRVFVFDFAEENHRLSFIKRNWTFYHKYSMVLKFWDPDKNIDEITMDTTNVWVRLPKLKPRLWSAKNLSSVISYIGSPIATDCMTALRTRMDFSRVLVEVKNGATLPDEIPIHGPTGTIKHPVIYKWRMEKCSGCGRVGHEVDKCRYKAEDKSKGLKGGVTDNITAAHATTVTTSSETSPVIPGDTVPTVPPTAEVTVTKEINTPAPPPSK